MNPKMLKSTHSRGLWTGEGYKIHKEWTVAHVGQEDNFFPFPWKIASHYNYSRTRPNTLRNRVMSASWVKLAPSQNLPPL